MENCPGGFHQVCVTSRDLSEAAHHFAVRPPLMEWEEMARPKRFELLTF
jgi:hypothetical protein